jgi:hypothetical protein
MHAIVYYATSHGYGRLNRTAAVAEAMPRGLRVVVKTRR